jgi:hypothetical protein
MFQRALRATNLISTTLALISITRCLLLLTTRFLNSCVLRAEYVDLQNRRRELPVKNVVSNSELPLRCLFSYFLDCRCGRASSVTFGTTESILARVHSVGSSERSVSGRLDRGPVSRMQSVERLLHEVVEIKSMKLKISSGARPLLRQINIDP